MAANSRAKPNCANGSNPYHECTRACSQKTKPHTNNKRTSGYRRSVTDGELGKKVNEKRRTYAGCPKASNPYHHCDDNCYKRLSDSGATPLKFDDSRKKLVSSKPEPPVLDSVPASKVGAIYLSDSSSSPNACEKKEVEPHSSEQIPSEPLSGEIQVIPDVKPQKDHLNQEDTVASHKVDNDSEDSDHVETESRIPVEGYKVKESFAPILRSILDKYGDIGATCRLESVVMRSYYVECVCFVVQQLQSSSLVNLNESKVNELLTIVKDVESAQLRVAWLRSMLDEIAENIQVIRQHHDVEVARANADGEAESLREELEAQLQTLAQKEQEVAHIKTRIPEIRDRLSKLEPISSELDNSMLSIKSIVDNLHTKSLIHELL